MAKQLYDYWFVQFDFPDENGKPYKSSGGKMVWNERLKREIPEGWEVKPLGRIVSSYKQGLIRSNKELSNSHNFAYLKMGDLDNEGGYSYTKGTRTNATKEEVDQYSLKQGDFLINVRNSREIVGKTCVIDYVEDNTLYNHMLVRIALKGISSVYLNMVLNTSYYKKLIDGIKQGTTTVIALYQEDLYRLPILVPESSIQTLFQRLASCYIQKKAEKVSNIHLLTKLRDELLPLLMNGQVSVNYDLVNDMYRIEKQPLLTAFYRMPSGDGLFRA